jgi:hypothetical protein
MQRHVCEGAGRAAPQITLFPFTRSINRNAKMGLSDATDL